MNVWSGLKGKDETNNKEMPSSNKKVCSAYVLNWRKNLGLCK